MANPSEVTRLLEATGGGSREAADRLLGLVYDELHAMAEQRMGRERRDHTLQPTALVHEAFLKLVDQSRVRWQGQTHFKAVAAIAMRRILADHGRAGNRQKRGGEWVRVPLDDAFALGGGHGLDGLALQEALSRMRQLDPRQADVVEFRIFGGLGSEETARMLDVTRRTVERDWKMGVAWLRRELAGETDDG